MEYTGAPLNLCRKSVKNPMRSAIILDTLIPEGRGAVCALYGTDRSRSLWEAFMKS